MVPSASTEQLPAGASLEVYLLGMVDFDAAQVLQDRLMAEIEQRNDKRGILLLCEHPPLITVGREGSRSHLACEPEELVARQIDVRWLNRGGGCIVHAPGQLAVYPLIPLSHMKLGLPDLRERVEQAVIDTCRELHIAAERDPARPGVWCRCGQLAQLGLAVRSWVSYQGLYLNLSPRMDVQRLLCVPWFESRLTSLSAQLVKPMSMAAVRESIVRRLASRLGYERFFLYTGHPLLRRTRRVVAYA